MHKKLHKAQTADKCVGLTESHLHGTVQHCIIAGGLTTLTNGTEVAKVSVNIIETMKAGDFITITDFLCSWCSKYFNMGF